MGLVDKVDFYCGSDDTDNCDAAHNPYRDWYALQHVEPTAFFGGCNFVVDLLQQTRTVLSHGVFIRELVRPEKLYRYTRFERRDAFQELHSVVLVRELRNTHDFL